MSSRIVVMHNGVLEQVGTPDEVYYHPRTSYVAQFVGNANILTGKAVERTDGVLSVQIGQETIKVLDSKNAAIGEMAVIAVRSEHIMVTKEHRKIGLSAVVKEKSFAGGMLRMTLILKDGKELIASRHGIDADCEEGDEIFCFWEPEQAVLVDEKEAKEGESTQR